jgi:hypothetical protein
VIARRYADQMMDLLRTPEEAHGVARHHATLAVPDQVCLLRPGRGEYRVNKGAELSGVPAWADSADMDPARTTAAAMESVLFNSDMETSSLLRFVEQAGRTPPHRLWRSSCFFTLANGSGSAVDSARMCKHRPRCRIGARVGAASQEFP